jgi:DNA-binding CsgD family transcriptional regulator
MASVDTRVADWVDIIAELLAVPLTEFPVQRISDHLNQSFDADVCSYDWRDADGTMGLRATARKGVSFGGRTFPEMQAYIRQCAPRLLDAQPLVRWFFATGDPAAQTTGRVPALIARSHHLEQVRTILREVETEQQMAVPLQLSGVQHRVLVISRRGGEDFSDEDLSVARRVQPLLAGLYGQCALLAQQFPPPPPEKLLTGRELAVLHLMADGLTAVAIGHRLSMSPRTAEKHLQSVYRKLTVRDRVSAVREAQALGFIGPLSPERRLRLLA